MHLKVKKKEEEEVSMTFKKSILLTKLIFLMLKTKKKMIQASFNCCQAKKKAGIGMLSCFSRQVGKSSFDFFGWCSLL